MALDRQEKNKEKEIKWIYERNGKNIYRRPFMKLKPRQLIVLGLPIYDN
jgi:hypothetical protein